MLVRVSTRLGFRSSLERLRLRSWKAGGAGIVALLAVLTTAVWPAAAARAVEDRPAIVFAARVMPGSARHTPIARATRGRLMLMELATGDVVRHVRVLVDGSQLRDEAVRIDAPIDVLDPEVSYDGERVVFAGFSPIDNAWRIYEIDIEGSNLRKVTRSDRDPAVDRLGGGDPRLRGYDDVDPSYLPDGRIVFVSTRQPGLAPDERTRITNLYVVNADGTDTHRITSERFGADTPTVDPSSGQIVYSRWWRSAENTQSSTRPAIPPGNPGYGGATDGAVNQESNPDRAVGDIEPSEFPGINSWFLASINPDGTDLAMVSGFRVDREQTQAYRPRVLPDGNIVALFIPQTPFIGMPRGEGARLFHPGASRPVPIGGPQVFPTRRTPRADFFYASIEPYADEQFLVSGSRRADPRTVQLYLQRLGERPEPLYEEAGWSALYAVPVLPQPTPPVIEDRIARPLTDHAPQTLEEAIEVGGQFTFRSENIHANAPIEMEIAGAPPVGRDLVIDFFMQPVQLSERNPPQPILIHSRDIPIDGKVEVELPAGVPLFEVLRRPNGRIPIGNDGQIFHVGGFNFNRAGENGACVGCHAGHTMMEIPEDPSISNIAPSAKVIAFPGPGGVNIREPFRPRGVVDRQLDAFVGEWTAGRLLPEESFVRLQWTVPVRAEHGVVYSPSHGEGERGERNQVISAFAVRTYLNDALQDEIAIDQAIEPTGTRFVLNNERPFDALELAIDASDVSGVYEGMSGVALSEVEVIAKVADSSAPKVWFLRGEVNCSGTINLVDLLQLFNGVFHGSDAICCEAAADVDADGTLSITDGIHLGNMLFLRGSDPAAPFPDCGIGDAMGFSCDTQSCE